jgi:tetratricopeptide (TPR) repeat protein
MSRSEHATRRHPGDPGDLPRKRRIKRLAADDRARPTVATEGAGIPITVEAGGPLVHYPASAKDIRAVMARLPPGTTDGIGSIDLCIGAVGDEGDRAPDPLVGRAGIECMRGVYMRPVLGWYLGDGARVQVFAYVYDPAHPLRHVIEPYLRIRQLSTFVHEVGHHVDYATRYGARWCHDDEDEREAFAEERQHAWVRDVIVPYLEEEAPDEIAALRAWVVQHGGVDLPLAMLAGDPRRVRGPISSWFGVDGAFETLVEKVHDGTPSPGPQVAFANELHYGENYDEAHQILDRVLADHPDHLDALVLRADIFVHQQRHDEAASTARAVIVRDPDRVDAWEVLLDVAMYRGDWAAVPALVDRMLALQPDPRAGARRRYLADRVRARVELGDLDAAVPDLEWLEGASTTERTTRWAQALRAFWLLRRGDPAAALALANQALVGAPRHVFLLAIQLDATHTLGQPSDPDPDLVAYLSERLRAIGHATWAARLERLASRCR